MVTSIDEKIREIESLLDPSRLTEDNYLRLLSACKNIIPTTTEWTTALWNVAYSKVSDIIYARGKKRSELTEDEITVVAFERVCRPEKKLLEKDYWFVRAIGKKVDIPLEQAREYFRKQGQ